MPFAPGFVASEATDAVNLCMQLNGTGLTGLDGQPEPPREVSSRWTSDSRQTESLGPFNNAWSAWKSVQDSDLYAVVVRGTVGDFGSILDDVLATSVRANSFLPVRAPDGSMNSLPLQLVSSAKAANAAVHLGFTWGAAILLYHRDEGILKYLLGLPTGSKILIAGHSQGAAIATLLHAMLLHASTDGAGPLAKAMKPKDFDFKSYVFAQPKPGNWQFAHDFAQVAGNRGLAHCINNDSDWVPQVPLSLEQPDEVTGNPIGTYLAEKHRAVELLVNEIGHLAQLARSAISDVAECAAVEATDYLGKNIDVAQFLSTETGGNTAPNLDYVQCGRFYSLCGKATPAKHSDDVLWQHHCGNYAELLADQVDSFK